MHDRDCDGSGVQDPTGRGDRDPDKDIDTFAAGNDSPQGIWSDGTTLWVADKDDGKLYAYNLATRAHDPDKDFNTLKAAANELPWGLWSDGITMWVADNDDDKLYAYNLNTKLRDAAKDSRTLTRSNNQYYGLASKGTTLWMANGGYRRIYTFNLKTRAYDHTKNFTTLKAAGNHNPRGIWSDGTTLWVADSVDNKLYAYKVFDRTRDPDKDFGSLGAANIQGLWSDGATMWVARWVPDGSKLYAYQMPARLTVSSVTKTAATLALANHAGSWWLKRTSPSDGTCTAGETDFSHDLSTLTGGTTYTYTAYRDGSCATTIDTVTFTPRHAPGERDPYKDFDPLDAENNSPRGLWSDGATMWVADSTDNKLYAYKMSDQTRDSAKDFQAANVHILAGIWSDDTTMWVVNAADFKLYAYKTSDQTRDASKDFDSLDAANNHSPWGLWSDGTTMWVADTLDHKIYAYQMPSRLTASSVTATTATLTLANHTGDWYYQANRAPHTSCSSAQTTASASLASLTANTSYTYTAYNKTGCNSVDAIASVTFSTPGAGGGALGAHSPVNAALTFTPRSGAVGAAMPGAPEAARGRSAGDPADTRPSDLPDGEAGRQADADPPTGYVSNLASAQSGDSDIDATQRQAVAFTTGPHPGGYVLKHFTAALRKVGGDGGLVLTLHAAAGGPYGADSQPSATVRATLAGSAPVSGAYAWAYVAAAHLYRETTVPSDNGWDIGSGHVSQDGGEWAGWDDWYHARIDFAAPASSAVTVDNLEQVVHDDACFPSGDSPCAVAFTTGDAAGGYTLDAVTARFGDADDPEGVLGDVVVTLHADGGGVPGALLAALSGVNPVAAGEYTYVCFGAGCSLAPGTTYFVQVGTSAGEVVNEAYEWVSTLSDHETAVPAGNGWTLADGTVGYGSAWQAYPDAGLLKVSATTN